VKHGSEGLVRDFARPGQSPRTSLLEQVVHGDGGMTILTADRERDLTVIGQVRLRHQVISGAERHRPVRAVQQ
jgi:hypothetical protein